MITNLFLIAKKCFFLAVFLAPLFNHTQSNVTIKESSSVMLHCNATGNPTPAIHWSYIKNGLTKKTSNGESLFLSDMRRNESGIYRCIASNGVGSPAFSDAFVDVQCKQTLLFQTTCHLFFDHFTPIPDVFKADIFPLQMVQKL